jgi:4-amino-4-deoxy-L-arabinose transferase-like glycosyltransferase
MNRPWSWLRSKKFLPALLGLLIFISLAVNVATIYQFPSWDDEAYMANISFNLSQGQGAISDIIPGGEAAEVTRYGPVYFVVQSAIIRLFGLHDWLFRLPNLVSGYLCILLIALALRNSHISRRWVAAYACFAILDISFNRNIVSGRMDMMAACLVSLSLYLVSLGRLPARRDGFRWLAAGAAAALAFLTTPRALFLLPVVALVALAKLSSSHSRGDRAHPWRVLLALIAFALPLAAWIGSVGGVAPYLAIQNSGVVRTHIAPSFFRSPYDNIGISILLLLSFFGYKHVRSSPIIAGLFLNYLAFSLFVKEVGPYAGMIMPFVLAGVAALLSKMHFARAGKALLIFLIVLPSSAVLALRAADLPLNASCRQATSLDKLTHQMAAEGQIGWRIVADYKYYFHLESPRNQLQVQDGSPEQIAAAVQQADMVLQDPSLPPPAPGFVPAATLSCTPRRLPMLPASFLERSIFNETIYIKPKVGGS